MELVTGFRSFSPAEAQLIRSRLDAANIPAEVMNELAALSMDGWAHPLPKGEYVSSALRTRHAGSESADLAVAAAFGVRQLVGAFARGSGESAASWLALAEDSGDKPPHSKRWRDCERAASVPTPGLCNALNRYKGEGWGGNDAKYLPRIRPIPELSNWTSPPAVPGNSQNDDDFP